MNLLKNFWKEEDGQDLIEYALLAGFIIVTTTGVLQAIGTEVSTVYTNVEAKTKVAAS
jgi:Flp pilus assembly pilin Flp